MDIVKELDLIEYDKEIAQRAKAEIVKLRGLIADALDSCDSKNQFGTELYAQMCEAVGQK